MTAREFAIKAHGDQMYGDRPYVAHLDEVADTLIEFGYLDWRLYEAAYLHDSLEDTSVTEQELFEKFPASFHFVVAVTGTGCNRKERNASAYRKIAGLQLPTRLKLADRIANVRAAMKIKSHHLEMYCKEYPEFRAALWRDGDAVDMWACLDGLMGGGK